MKNSAGFTLLEMAIVIALVGLLLSGLLMPISAQMDAKKIADSEKKMDEIKDSLLGFAAVNGYLPCPAVSATTGTENRNVGTGACAGTQQGFLPWSTLGLKNDDSYGNLFRYSVTPSFSNSGLSTGPNPKPTLSSNGNITIQSRDNNGALYNLSTVGGIPVVVLSQGKNGHGAVNSLGINQQAVPASAVDENTNATGATTFVYRTQTPATAPGGEFDDLVSWISPHQLFARMIEAGKLP